MTIGRWIKKIPIVDGEYVPVVKRNIDFFTGLPGDENYSVRKVSLDKIKVDTRRMAYPNVPSLDEALHLIQYFDIENWLPIRLDDEYYLLDGQHRMIIARLLGLKYLDAVMPREKE